MDGCVNWSAHPGFHTDCLWRVFVSVCSKWSHWDGPESNKYSVMKFDKGQNCWNGPDRSVKVRMHTYTCLLK